MKKTIFFLALLAITISLTAHPWKPGHYVIIDTDGGIDDLRTLTMLLSSPDVRVLAITVSPGVLNADSVYAKVKALKRLFHHEGIPVAVNRNNKFRSPDFEPALKMSWGPGTSLKGSSPDCRQVVKDILSFEKTKISFICLGGMSTAEWLLREVPGFGGALKEIIWSCDGSTGKEGFNYSIDRNSAEKILKENIPVRFVSGSGKIMLFDDDFRKAVSQVPGVYPDAMTSLFGSEMFSAHGYFREANDELVAVYLHYPGLFLADGDRFIMHPDSLPGLRASVLRILAGETVARNQVIKDMPGDPSFYFADIEPSVTGIIKKYGKDEWASGVLANELHRHLGTYAIIGVKMGIRAREYFNTGVDEFRAVSYAGSTPPLSCMNDGLQVSTGATPGHGLLTVINENTSPSAEFTYMNRKIRLTLKPDISGKISSELKEINFVYGLDSNIYWELVRKNTIRYWRDLDRHDIFIIEEL